MLEGNVSKLFAKLLALLTALPERDQEREREVSTSLGTLPEENYASLQ